MAVQAAPKPRQGLDAIKADGVQWYDGAYWLFWLKAAQHDQVNVPCICPVRQMQALGGGHLLRGNEVRQELGDRESHLGRCADMQDAGVGFRRPEDSLFQACEAGTGGEIAGPTGC